MKIQLYDTTLRDGTQREGISLSCEDKLKIAKRLDELGVDYIEGGWPGSNPKDVEFFNRVRTMPFRHALITSFGSTCRVGGDPATDANIRALLDSGTTVCTVVGKTSMLHVKDVLQTTPEENLRIIEESVAYLVKNGRRVIYDAEHFFDGFKLNRAYAIETIKAAFRGGAETVTLCETNGGSLPWDVAEIVKHVASMKLGLLGVHAHNDAECAVANSLAAIREGCIQVQGTMNGYGERCGNANLISIIASLELKMGMKCLPEGHLKKLTEVSHFITEIANLAPDEHLPYVGKSAFAHKGGIHVAAIRRNENSYQHIDPALVGNSPRVVISELSGRGNVLSKAEEMGVGVESHANVGEILNEIKMLEAKGFSFEAAEASIAMLLKRQQRRYEAPFELVDFVVGVEHRMGRGLITEASIKIRVGNQIIHTVSEGNGPVNALDAAIRKALLPVYPQLAQFHLADYKVRILDGENGTAAVTRVLIDTQNGKNRWSTVGASCNIIEASWRALCDSIEYGILTVIEKENV